MNSLIIALCSFLASLVVHSILHRRIKKTFHTVSYHSFIVYIVGLGCTLFLQFSGIIPSTFPLCGTTIYILATLCMIFIYMGPAFDYGPSHRIMEFFLQKKSTTKSEIYTLFLKEDTIQPRLQSLKNHSLVMRQSNTYFGTKKGRMTAYIIKIIANICA